MTPRLLCPQVGAFEAAFLDPSTEAGGAASTRAVPV